MTSKRTYTFDIEPVPASRPRISKWGAFYGKRYEQFRRSMVVVLASYDGQEPLSGPIKAELEFVCKKPKTTRRKFPVGDVDNFAKGPLDSMTKHGGFWKDDDQIVDLTVTKRYPKEGEKYGIIFSYDERDSRD
jgi:Holliday junction resolvase RusA-like endonuclease|tara:strand:- start:138 stop:536 length:399 start_codon:yes stop_codon:yes gene_type:complete